MNDYSCLPKILIIPLNSSNTFRNGSSRTHGCLLIYCLSVCREPLMMFTWQDLKLNNDPAHLHGVFKLLARQDSSQISLQDLLAVSMQ